MEVIQHTSDVSGTATLVQDALGQVALQSRTPGDTTNAPTWSLQDRLGSTVAQTATNGRTDLIFLGILAARLTASFASRGFLLAAMIALLSAVPVLILGRVFVLPVFVRSPRPETPDEDWS